MKKSLGEIVKFGCYVGTFFVVFIIGPSAFDGATGRLVEPVMLAEALTILALSGQTALYCSNLRGLERRLIIGIAWASLWMLFLLWLGEANLKPTVRFCLIVVSLPATGWAVTQMSWSDIASGLTSWWYKIRRG